jgi:hypothetical protein
VTPLKQQKLPPSIKAEPFANVPPRSASEIHGPQSKNAPKLSADQTMANKLKPDLFTFVAEVAVQLGNPIPISCNCGGIITVMPPLQEELVVCAKCESCIKLLVLEGDPGYVIGRAPDGEPMLIPVQGSSKEKLEISPKERKETLERIKMKWIEKKS